jgi:hypothetical protein
MNPRDGSSVDPEITWVEPEEHASCYIKGLAALDRARVSRCAAGHAARLLEIVSGGRSFRKSMESPPAGGRLRTSWGE